MTAPDRPDRPDRLAARAGAALDAVGLTTTARRDAALAVATAVVSVALVGLALADPHAAGVAVGPGGVVAVLVLLAAQGAALVLRRHHPVACLGVVVALQVVLVAVVPPGAGVRGPAPVLAAVGLGSRRPARSALRVAGVATAVETVASLAVAVLPALRGAVGAASSLEVGWSVAGQLLAAAVVYLGSALLGGYLRTRRRYVDLLRLRATEAEETQRARAEAAVGAERLRMARELHDVAAHHLAGMVVQAAMVERLVDRDPEAARRTAAEVRARGRATLDDLRQVVVALRGDGVDAVPPDETAPLGAGGLERLVADTAPGAVVVSRGAPHALAPAAEAGLQRVAREALANAREHAPGAAVTVTLEHRPDATVLEVRNGPPTSPDRVAPPAAGGRRGFGMIGMRERAELVGGILETGPTEDGGWCVRLTLPWGGGGTP